MSLRFPTVSGYSGFWQLTGDALPYGPTPRAQDGMRSRIDWQLARLMKRNQYRDVAAAALALNGAAVGGALVATYPRVQAPASEVGDVTEIGDFGGNRVIETTTVISSTTNAADKSYIDDLWNGNLLERSLSYPTVVGSGGGGMQVNGANGF